MKKILICLVLFIFISCRPLFSQGKLSDYGSINGLVVDGKHGTPLDHTWITINDTITTTFTDIDGRFSIDSLVEGKYKLRLTYIGYKTKVFENIEIKKGEIKNLFVGLKPEKIEDCYEKYYTDIHELFLNYKECCEKAFGRKDIEELQNYVRIYVLPSFQSEYLIEMKRNDPNYEIKLYIVDSTDINISIDNSEIHYTDSTGKKHIKPCDADYTDNAYPEDNFPDKCTIEDVAPKDYIPTVRIFEYEYCNKNFYNLIFSTFELMRIDTMHSIEYCQLAFTDGTSIFVETNIGGNVNNFIFHEHTDYNDKRYVWISNLALELKNILIYSY